MMNGSIQSPVISSLAHTDKLAAKREAIRSLHPPFVFSLLCDRFSQFLLLAAATLWLCNNGPSLHFFPTHIIRSPLNIPSECSSNANERQCVRKQQQHV